MRLATIAIVLAAVTGIFVPIVTIGAILFTPGNTYVASLVKNRELTGSLAALAAASFAALGVIVDVQARRHAAVVAGNAQKQRLASALLGEISAIWRAFDDFDLEQLLRERVAYLESGGSLTVGVRVPHGLDRVFRSDPTAVGWLPVPLPEMTARFYGLYMTITHDINSLADLIEVEPGKRIISSVELSASYVVPLKDLEIMRETVIQLLPELDKVASGLVSTSMHLGRASSTRT